MTETQTPYTADIDHVPLVAAQIAEAPNDIERARILLEVPCDVFLKSFSEIREALRRCRFDLGLDYCDTLQAALCSRRRNGDFILAIRTQLLLASQGLVLFTIDGGDHA